MAEKASYLSFRKGKYLVLKDPVAIELFYNDFLSRPKFSSQSMRRVFAALDKMFLFFLKLALFLRLYVVCPKSGKMDSEVLIRRTGTTKEQNVVELLKSDGKLVIRKIFPDKRLFEAEKTFLQTYKTPHPVIKLPKALIDEEHHRIDYEFTGSQTLERKLRTGEINEAAARNIFLDICQKMAEFYTLNNQTDEEVLAHGDFCPCNIIFKNSFIYLIDFSSSHKELKAYDFSVLFFRIATEHRKYLRTRYFEKELATNKDLSNTYEKSLKLLEIDTPANQVSKECYERYRSLFGEDS